MIHANGMQKIIFAMHFLAFCNAFVALPSNVCTHQICGGVVQQTQQRIGTDRLSIRNTSTTVPRSHRVTPLHADSSGTDDIDSDIDIDIDSARGTVNSNVNGNISRRDVIFTTAATLITATTVSAANALETTKPKTSSLEDLRVGEGKWTQISDSKAARAGTYTMAKSVITPSFATYATRFLINFDEGVNQWWKEVKVSNSLLPSNEERTRLGINFGDLSRSIQISLEHYILYPNDNDIDRPENINPKDTAAIQRRFEDLFQVFLNAYGGNSNAGLVGGGDDEFRRQLGLLFSTLPPRYQPVNGLRENVYKKSRAGADGSPTSEATTPSKISVAFTEELEDLLPSKYAIEFDSKFNSFRIQPSVAMYEIGVDNEFGQNAVATAFGPLSSNLLKRQKPDLSLGLYSLLGINGALACALTHGAVIPFDVVKTRLQTDPERYSNLIDGTMSIAKTEGIQGFTLGAQATISGYMYYGLSVYPSYAFSKWFLSHSVLSPAYATAHADAIALVAGAIAAVIASLGLTPLEACRIRTVAEPEVYRDIGLMGTLKVISNEDETLGWKSLYAGLPALMTRQVIFGSVKFLAFERACEAFFLSWPFLRDSPATALGVTLMAGALSGVLSSVVSQPADSVLTYISKNSVKQSLASSISTMVEDDGVGSLFRGLGGRCIWAAAIISGQFVLYDIFRSALGINTEDLSQVFEFAITSSNSIN
jgi:solute carrier family 25 phosphate transporter 3